MQDVRQTQEYAKHLAKIGWKVRRLHNTNYFIKKIPILGNVIKVQRPEIIMPKDIELLIKKYKAFQIIIEPKDKDQTANIKYLGLKQSKSPYLPTKTLQIDLTKSKEDLYKNLKKDCKYALRKTNNLEIVSEHNWQTFGNNSLLLTTKDKSSEAVFLLADKIAYYWKAKTNKRGRANLAQYHLVWRGIMWAKKMRAKVFDFEGIYDSRFPNKKWLGFTHFKKSFGGYEIEYPGCFVKTNFKNIISRL